MWRNISARSEIADCDDHFCFPVPSMCSDAARPPDRRFFFRGVIIFSPNHPPSPCVRRDVMLTMPRLFATFGSGYVLSFLIVALERLTLVFSQQPVYLLRRCPACANVYVDDRRSTCGAATRL